MVHTGQKMSANAQLDSSTEVHLLTERFRSLYGTSPEIFRAPGRVNLIGEHTDYNDGFVMPAAIDFSTCTAIAPRADRVLVIRSEQFAEANELPLDQLSAPSRKHWSDYVRGVAATLATGGQKLTGANLLISSDVPLGAGLSSSAALEVSVAFALASISGINLSGLEMARLCQRAEHEFAGTHCGIMDQFIAVFGRPGHALMLDCRSLDYTALPIPPNVRIVICNTQVKHELAGGEYNRRRADCETGVAQLKRSLPAIKALRDVTPESLDAHKSELAYVVYRRCRHIVSENQRVLAAAAALTSANMKQFGELMYASHASLRDDYEVSCSELDLLVEIASSIPGVYGARMTGGGFGGCTVNLVDAGAIDDFQAELAGRYRAATGITPPVYVSSAAAGAGPVEI
jgi:galactokinase